ncbi:MAG: T9SS type A sorting domain-containing protein, partial [Bacteroides sp.]
DGSSFTGTINNITAIIDKIKKDSPTTIIYVQSILPVNNGYNIFGQSQSGTGIANINQQLPAICQSKGAIFIDVWSELRTSASDNNLNGNYTNDGLHMLGAGYCKWASVIQNYVGTSSTYTDKSFTPISNVNHRYINQRLSDFDALPVNNGDVLMLGDYYINTGEWHELLRNSKVKNRGIGIDMPATSISLDNLYDMLPYVIKGTPSKVFIYCGLVDLLGGTSSINAATNLNRSVEYIKSHSSAQIYIQSLLPRNNSAENAGKLTSYNTEIKKLADNNRVHYIDLYSSFIGDGNKINPLYASNASNISAIGYARWANLIYKDIDSAIQPLSENFIHLKSAINTAETLRAGVTLGTEVGCYSPTACTALDNAITEAKNTLASNTATPEDQVLQQQKLSTAIQNLKATLVLPLLSNTSSTYWYRLSTPDRGNRYITSQGNGRGVTGETSTATNNSQWKFTQRTDNTWDMINRANNTYLSPTASFNTQFTCTSAQPSTGWTLKPAEKLGRYIITSGTVQINQTNTAPVYNWGEGTNISDLGCQYKISSVETEVVKIPEAIYTLHSTIFDGNTPLRLSNEQATSIFALTNYTVVIDVTTASPLTNPQMLIGSSDTNNNSQFFGISLYNAKYFGVRYTNAAGVDAYYSKTFDNESDVLLRHQLIFTMKSTSPNYTYYKDGASLGGIDVLPTYPYTTFGTIPNVNAVTIGGVITANTPNKYPFKGTIHSLRIYPEPLTAAQIAAITYPEDTPVGITSPINAKKIITLDGTTLWTSDEGTSRALSIFSIEGKLIQQTENTASRSFNLSTLPHNTYIVRILTTNGQIHSSIIML